MSKSSSKVSDKNKKRILFRPEFAQNGFWGKNFENLTPDSELSLLRYANANVLIFRQNGQPCLFRPKFAQKLILGSEFGKSKSRFGISSFKIPGVPIFRQIGQL